MKSFFKIFLILSMLIFFPNWSFAKTVKLQGAVKIENTAKKGPKIIKSSVSKDTYGGFDIQVLKAGLYYYPEADMNYFLLKQEAQKQYPHLLGYREIDGLYQKALSESTVIDKLSAWKAQGGPSPYYIKAGTELRNEGSAAVTDINLKFVFNIKVAPLRANAQSLTTDYTNLTRNARWQYWMTKNVTLDILPPGENTIIYTDFFSLCPMFQKLNDKWPLYLKVNVTSFSSGDPKKQNNSANYEIKMIPDHFIMKAIH